MTTTDNARLVPISEADFATVAHLGETIWREHYTPIIGAAQVEYMVSGRYSPEKLRAYVNARDRWLELLESGGRYVGYCSYALSDTPGEIKLEQLYLLAECRGTGLGAFMLRHVEARARELGRDVLMLTVNKHNAGSIAVYKKTGFTVREEAVFDIGNGFVMDDYVMKKRL
jgi:diamine N-acetyltransferase